MVTHSPTIVTQSPIATKATVVMHSPQTTQAITTLLTTTVPAVDDDTSLSEKEVFLYITVPGLVVLIFLTFCGLILLLIMLIRYNKKQAKLDMDVEGRASPKKNYCILQISLLEANSWQSPDVSCYSICTCVDTT